MGEGQVPREVSSTAQASAVTGVVGVTLGIREPAG